jgi:GR25 family glycosyltransferase involved in LPS biosynthesis
MVESAFPYHGVYINLDRSAGRREQMEAQLARLGLKDRYARFPAADGSALNVPRSTLRPGELGCFVSHYRVLQEARGLGKCVHILEDDAVLSEHVRPVIEDAAAAGPFERFDILFTDTLVSLHLGMLKGLKAAFDATALPPVRPLRLADLQVIDLAQQNFACTTSLVVGVNSIERVVGLYRAELDRGPTRPVDLFIRDCLQAGTLRAACLFPFVTSFDLKEVAATTIAGGAGQAANPSVAVLAVLRYLFFVGRDLDYAKACLDAATQHDRRPTNPHHAMIVQALEFVLSPDFQEF